MANDSNPKTTPSPETTPNAELSDSELENVAGGGAQPHMVNGISNPDLQPAATNLASQLAAHAQQIAANRFL